MKLTYTKHGDYYFPNLGMTEEEKQAFGKYGCMRMTYLREHRPGLFNRMLLSGVLAAHLHEIDRTCYERLDRMIPEMAASEGVTEELKETNHLAWTAAMNSIKSRAEEVLLNELIYV